MPKVLVVDDDEDIVFMIKSVLEKNGFQVSCACDGHQALKTVKADAPDLMIVDLTMPVMDGWRLSMKVREDERCKEIPIIVLSGLLDPHANQEEEEPHTFYMSKPFDILKLAEKVKSLL